MKKMLSLVATMMFVAGAVAQNVNGTSVQIGTITAPGYSVNMQRDVRTVEEALTKRLKEADVKVKKKRSARGGRRGASAEVGGNASEKEPKAAREPKVRRKRSTSPSSSSSGSARVSVRRQRH